MAAKAAFCLGTMPHDKAPPVEEELGCEPMAWLLADGAAAGADDAAIFFLARISPSILFTVFDHASLIAFLVITLVFRFC